MLYSALTRPWLWPSDDLQEARLECLDNLKSSRLKPESRQRTSDLLQAIDDTLANRGQRPRPQRH